MISTIERLLEAQEISALKRQYHEKGGKGKQRRPFDYSIPRFDRKYVKEVLKPFSKEFKMGSRLLDLGCGTGLYADYLESRGMETVRLDISKLALDRQSVKDSLRVQSTAWRLPFSANSFDAIHCKDAITHINPRYRILFFKEVSRVLKPKGSVIFVSAFYHEGKLKQYVIDARITMDAASLVGFEVPGCKFWKPNTVAEDWYYLGKEPENRFVLTFKNNKNA